jgi:hypothetical protein
MFIMMRGMRELLIAGIRTFRVLKNRLLARLASNPIAGNASSEKDAIITPSTIGNKDSNWAVFGAGLESSRDNATVKTGSDAFTV